ncbi:MAG: hypothetical protein NT027_10080 [Proteobacteria bacterium]|nr:hypothetical protein [Pseudomonadota bacterium]
MSNEAHMPTESELVIALRDPNHFVVCKALRAIKAIPSPEAATIQAVVLLIQSDIIAVERLAIVTLATFHSMLDQYLPQLEQRVSKRLSDAGCDFSCCGYFAFHGPIDAYIDLIGLIVDIKSDTGKRKFLDRCKDLDNFDILVEILAKL